jgi:hypothetical protein
MRSFDFLPGYEERYSLLWRRKSHDTVYGEKVRQALIVGETGGRDAGVCEIGYLSVGAESMCLE